MRETQEEYVLAMDLVNRGTGEVSNVDVAITKKHKNYSIRKLTTRINAMNLFQIMEQVCKSSKDIGLTNYLLDMSDSSNQIRINNVSKLASELNVSRSKLNATLKNFEDVRPDRLLIKQDTGVYQINPFIFIGKRIRSNKLREELQAEWLILLDESL